MLFLLGPALSFLFPQVPANCFDRSIWLHKILRQLAGGSQRFIRCGQWWIIGTRGPNDVGKATTVEIMTGLRDRDGCRVSIFGLDPSKSALGIKSRARV